MKHRYLILILGVLVLQFPVPSKAQTYTELQKILPGDREANDEFGSALAITDLYLAVGAQLEDHDASGGNFLEDAGSVYLYERNGTTWPQAQKLVPSTRSAFANFGHDVALSGDLLVVGAPNEDLAGGTLSEAGAVYIFERQSNGNWVENAKLTPTSGHAAGDLFGYAVAIDGDAVLIGAIGKSLELGGGASLAEAGAVYQFERNNLGNWLQTNFIQASDAQEMGLFGSAIAMEGNTAVISAPNHDWGGNGVGTGQAYSFNRFSGGLWIESQILRSSDPAMLGFFGIEVAISGDALLIGADGEGRDENGNNVIGDAGAAYFFDFTGNGTWSFAQKVVANDRHPFASFGISVGLSGDYAIIGAFQDSTDRFGNDPFRNAGAGYIYEYNGSSWDFLQKISAADRAGDDFFGVRVAIAGGFAAVSATGEDEDQNGANTLSDAGTVYLFYSQAVGREGANDLSQLIRVFPNPTQGSLQVLPEQPMEAGWMRLHDLRGQLLWEAAFNGFGMEVDLPPVAAGMYLFEVLTPEGRLEKRLRVD